jgi:serine/threonine protein phosphatase 1
MGRTFVLGDIHGARRALIQCFEAAQFDYEDDVLICLGDVADGWPETRQCVDELLKVKHLVYLLGNHDFWTLQWLETGYAEDVWKDQGGTATMLSYHQSGNEAHLEFFKRAQPYYIKNNSLFVHAGILPGKPLEQQGLQIFCWDRTLAKMAQDFSSKGLTTNITNYEEVFIGHTPIAAPQPIQYCEVWMMDTGAGWSGVLSMTDIDSKEHFVSDPVPQLYPGVEGRKKL